MSIDWDDLKERIEERRQRNMESFEKTFNEQQAKTGGPSFAEVMGAKEKPQHVEAQVVENGEVEVSQSVVDAAQELVYQTEDETAGDVMRRALGVYTSIVKHARAGGKVQFVKEGAEPRTLKVRLAEIPEVEAEVVDG